MGYEWARKVRRMYDCYIVGTSNDDVGYLWNKRGFPFLPKRLLAIGRCEALESIIDDLHQRSLRQRSET